MTAPRCVRGGSGWILGEPLLQRALSTAQLPRGGGDPRGCSEPWDVALRDVGGGHGVGFGSWESFSSPNDRKAL